MSLPSVLTNQSPFVLIESYLKDLSLKILPLTLVKKILDSKPSGV